MKFCDCESSKCAHGHKACCYVAKYKVVTIWGTFYMCQTCAQNMPSEYLVDNQSILPLTA